jgi:hypothetical protein
MLRRAAVRRGRGVTRGEAPRAGIRVRARASHSKARSCPPMSDMPGLGNPLGDEPSAELSLSEQSIVSRTEDAEIVGRLAAPARPRFFVVELSGLACSAALSVAAHERAAQPIPRRDDAHDRLTSARGVSRRIPASGCAAPRTGPRGVRDAEGFDAARRAARPSTFARPSEFQ